MYVNFQTFIMSIVIAMSIPSAFTGFCFWLIQRKIVKNEKKKDEKESARMKNEILLAKCVGACFALGEATAQAIVEKKCNGKMSAALDYATKVKHEQKDFFMEQGIQNFI
jgi:hypothetical protein